MGAIQHVNATQQHQGTLCMEIETHGISQLL